MARRSTGGIVERQTRRGLSYGVRFRALGKRQFLHVGYAVDGVTREEAERELSYVLEQVRRGEWRPAAESEPVRAVPGFHQFASEWHERRKLEGLRARTLEHLRWTLTDHLLPHFARMR